MEQINEKCIAYAAIPRIDKLKCLICEIDSIVIQDSLGNSMFHYRTLTCRSIIHEMPEIITSPTIGRKDNRIYIIAPNELMISEKLQNILHGHKLLFKESQPVNEHDYGVCLKYTIECRIAPRWTRIGQYYIKEIDFSPSTLSNKIWDAVELNIRVTSGYATLELQAVKIRIPFLRLEDLQLPRFNIDNFRADPNGKLDLHNIAYVLPNTTKANILSVYKTNPDLSRWKNYEELRRHWKNMYGYRLPEMEDEIIYYEVKFDFPRSNIFVYPNVCLMNDSIKPVSYKNSTDISQQFIKDLRNTVESICEKSFDIEIRDDKENNNVQFSISPLNGENNYACNATGVAKCDVNILTSSSSGVSSMKSTQEVQANTQTEIQSFYFETKNATPSCSAIKIKTLKEKIASNRSSIDKGEQQQTVKRGRLS